MWLFDLNLRAVIFHCVRTHNTGYATRRKPKFESRIARLATTHPAPAHMMVAKASLLRRSPSVQLHASAPTTTGTPVVPCIELGVFVPIPRSVAATSPWKPLVANVTPARKTCCPVPTPVQDVCLMSGTRPNQTIASSNRAPHMRPTCVPSIQANAIRVLLGTVATRNRPQIQLSASTAHKATCRVASATCAAPPLLILLPAPSALTLHRHLLHSLRRPQPMPCTNPRQLVPRPLHHPQ